MFLLDQSNKDKDLATVKEILLRQGSNIVLLALAEQYKTAYIKSGTLAQGAIIDSVASGFEEAIDALCHEK